MIFLINEIRFFPTIRKQAILRFYLVLDLDFHRLVCSL